MNRRGLLAVVAGHVFALVSLQGFAQSAGSAKPDLGKAQQIVTQVCAACHGAEGVSVAPANPHLAGQHAEYVTLQLDHYKQGLRKNPVMAAMAATLSAEDAKALGIYFSQKKAKPGVAKDKALAELGQKTFRGGNSQTGLPACASCHSPTGAGLPVQYPRLAGQFAEYTFAQLQGFVRGDRGGEIKSAEGKLIEDVQGRVMSTIAARMSEREMKAVAEYISGLR